MQRAFWHKRWGEGRLGFHQQKVNSRLRKFWRACHARRGAKVFVPLCGKSLDLAWLAHAGMRVAGNELSEIACRAFFAENGLHCTAQRNRGENFVTLRARGIEILCGDFFALRAENLQGARFCYDRAALIALPASMRAAYAQKLAALLPPGARVLLISMDYDERKMKGPPFSVAEDEVRKIFARNFAVKIVTQSSGADIVGNLAARGLDTLNEKVYLLRRTHARIPRSRRRQNQRRKTKS